MYPLKFLNGRMKKLLRGEDIQPIAKKHNPLFPEARNAAIEDSLADFFDMNDVPLVTVSQLLSTRVGVKSLKNTLQILWFGGDLEYQHLQRTPLQVAGKYGTQETVRLLL